MIMRWITEEASQIVGKAFEHPNSRTAAAGPTSPEWCPDARGSRTRLSAALTISVAVKEKPEGLLDMAAVTQGQRPWRKGKRGSKRPCPSPGCF